MMRLTVNNKERTVDPEVTVGTIVRELTAPDGGEAPGGIAVDVNDEVVRRTAWTTTRLHPDEREDVPTALQGVRTCSTTTRSSSPTLPSPHGSSPVPAYPA